MLPTMYDLPSENPEEPDCLTNFISSNPNYCARPFNLLTILPNKYLSPANLNLYYDPYHPQWYKRGLVCRFGVWRLYQGGIAPELCDLAEEVVPFIAIELLSPGTEAEDLGRTVRGINQPPPSGKLTTNFRHSLLRSVRSLQQPIAGIYLKIRKI
ncbi:MAG UNVERIFIED_CONTAM: hypothetical protein LVR29_00220 [Microcystis novacekii LVE1205-3]|jgi:hypothetical protein